jgi:hypothetical protein
MEDWLVYLTSSEVMHSANLDIVLPFGNPGHEKLSLNVDSLWSGGPFENSSYDGGNPLSSVSSALPGIRDWIFKNGTGNVTALMGDDDNYGSYAVLGNLSVSVDNISDFTVYNRSLNLVTGVHTTTFKTSGSQYTRSARTALVPISRDTNTEQQNILLPPRQCLRLRAVL